MATCGSGSLPGTSEGEQRVEIDLIEVIQPLHSGHGDHLRQVSEESLEKVLAFCQGEQPTEYLKALSEAAGNRWNGPTGQISRPVWVYNPERLPLAELFFTPEGFITFDEIVTSGTHILIPIYYSVKEGIVSGCGACAKQTTPSKLEDRTEP